MDLLSIDALHTATPHLEDVVRFTGRSLPLKKHRCLEYCYTTLADLYIYIYKEQCTDTYGRLTPQLSIDICKTITPNKFHI